MKILIDIGHPGHVHLFKFFAKEMLAKGHNVLFTCREKEFEIDLLNSNGFEYKSFGKKYHSSIGKIWGMIEFDIKEFLTGIKFKPDILLSHGSIYAAHASFLLKRHNISFEDTFNFEQISLYKPFTDVILTGDYEHPGLGDKEIRYNGYHELAYLHPKRFTPDKSILNELGVKENEKYVIIRFVGWKATHDAGHKGISYENKWKAIREFEKYAKVFISSESKLPQEFESYRIKIDPHRMHDAMAFATLVIGESFTMPSEAAVLGTPTIVIHNTKSFYLTEQAEKYGLVFVLSESNEDQQKAITKGIELLNTPNIKAEWQRRRQKMLADKVDVTAFLVWFVENYPKSVKVMKENPEYQERFR